MNSHPPIHQVDYALILPLLSRAAKDRVNLKNSQNTVWFAWLGQEREVFGCAGLMFLPKGSARIKGFWVVEGKRGTGMGSALYQALIQHAVEKNCPAVEVLAYNPKFYESHGFKRLGLTRGNGAVRLIKIL